MYGQHPRNRMDIYLPGRPGLGASAPVIVYVTGTLGAALHSSLSGQPSGGCSRITLLCAFLAHGWELFVQAGLGSLGTRRGARCWPGASVWLVRWCAASTTATSPRCDMDKPLKAQVTAGLCADS